MPSFLRASLFTLFASSFLRASLFTLFASSVTVSAAPGLTVETSTASVGVEGLENLKATTTVVNTGNETLKLLNDPRGALSSFPENSFTITNTAGSRPSFSGAKVKFSHTYAAGLDDPTVFTILTPGASVNVTHDCRRNNIDHRALTLLTNNHKWAMHTTFTRSGAGDNTIESSNLFTSIDAHGIPKNLYASVVAAAKVKLSGNLAVSRFQHRRATFTNCSPSSQSQLDIAASNAQKHAINAYSYIKGVEGPSGTPRYTTWFGTYTQHRKDIVQYHFGKIRSNQFSSFTYSCTCPDSSIYGYVLPFQFGTIYLCGAFWNSPQIGTDSMGGALVQMASLFTANGGTVDYAYGQTDAMNLAISNAPHAILNADNHQYFAENNPFLP